MSECPRYIGCWSDLISDAGVVHLQSTLLSYLLPHFICNTERKKQKVAIKNQRRNRRSFQHSPAKLHEIFCDSGRTPHPFISRRLIIVWLYFDSL
jgi:hypothetical protein